MTCEHCVRAVTAELDLVSGVDRVGVTLRKGETSIVTVHSTEPLDEAALREAIDEAGYNIIELSVQQDALAAASQAERGAVDSRNAESRSAHPAGGGGCCGGCGCGGKGRQGQGIGLPIVPKN